MDSFIQQCLAGPTTPSYAHGQCSNYPTGFGGGQHFHWVGDGVMPLYSHLPVHHYTLTVCRLRIWGIESSPNCRFCQEEEETVEHLFW